MTIIRQLLQGKVVQGMQITAGTVKQNYKESVKRLLSSENAYSFMRSVKGTPAYWKQFLFEVLAMAKQLRIPTYHVLILDGMNYHI